MNDIKSTICDCALR